MPGSGNSTLSGCVSRTRRFASRRFAAWRCAALDGLLGALRDDLFGRLVLAQPDEDRVPQPAVAGPLGERDLGDELRLDPVHAARDAARRRAFDRRRARLERLQALHAASSARARRSRCRPCRRSAAAPSRARASPSSSAPNAVREPPGSVKPTTTNSSRCRHLILSQLRVRCLRDRGLPRASRRCLRGRACTLRRRTSRRPP